MFNAKREYDTVDRVDSTFGHTLFGAARRFEPQRWVLNTIDAGVGRESPQKVAVSCPINDKNAIGSDRIGCRAEHSDTEVCPLILL